MKPELVWFQVNEEEFLVRVLSWKLKTTVSSNSLNPLELTDFTGSVEVFLHF